MNEQFFFLWLVFIFYASASRAQKAALVIIERVKRAAGRLPFTV